MSIVAQDHDYQDGEQQLKGYLAYDARWQEPHPAVIIAHAWGGRNELVCQKARDMVGLGFVGFALDMYGGAKLGADNDENAELMQPFVEDRGLTRQRIGAALETVRGLELVRRDRIAAIGYCFGGLCVLELARSGADLQAVVSLHGLLASAAATADRIHPAVLVLHGHDDPMAPPADVAELQAELTAAHADWQVHVYGGTLHAFTNPEANDREFGTVYSATADRRSWASMTQFLAERLSGQ